MGSTEGRSVVVQENGPLGDHIRGDYEPCGWRVRSRLGESLARNRYPLGIYRSKFEERKVEVDRMDVGSKERVQLGGNDWRVGAIRVCRKKTWDRWCWRPWYHPRGGGRITSVAGTCAKRSPAGMGVISWDG